MKKSWSWHWEMDWLQDAKFCGENSVVLSVGVSQFILWTGTELPGKCSCPWCNLPVLQSQAEAPKYSCLGLHLVPTAVLGWAVPEHRPGREAAVKNSSGCKSVLLWITSVGPGCRGRRQHSARVMDWDTDWGATKRQKNDECVPKLLELWVHTQTCVWLFPL